MTKRPPGVVVSAVLLGSIALVLSFTAVGTLLASQLIHTPQLQNGAVVRTVVGIFGLLFAGMAAFEWCVMAGLLRSRNWARISIIILGALLALFSSGMIVLWLVLIPAMQNHSHRPLPASAPMMFAANGVIYGLLTALGIWWIVYFNLRPLRAFFTGRGSLPGAALAGAAEAGRWRH
jgi:hypothetical protein